jgi:glycogen operon protein
MVKNLRNRQAKNLLTTTILSVGIPMFLMGDEILRTQHGNNNNYCHDDAQNWMDWSLLEKHKDVHRFTKLLVNRRLLRSLDAERRRKTLTELLHEAPKTWHGVKVGEPDWNDWSHSLAFGIEVPTEKLMFHMMTNTYWEPLEFELPTDREHTYGPWQRWIDTALESPLDIVEWRAAPAISLQTYRVEAHSVVVLLRHLDD